MLLLRNLVEEKLKGLVLILDTNLTVIFCSRLQVFNMRRCLEYNIGMTCQFFLPCCKKKVFSCTYVCMYVCR